MTTACAQICTISRHEGCGSFAYSTTVPSGFQRANLTAKLRHNRLSTIIESLIMRREREFGLIVGGVLLALTAWWFYRGKFPVVSKYTLAIGALLVLLGLVWPRALVWPNKAWMALAEVLAFVSTRVILAVVFYGIVTPIGVVKRLFGWDPLHRRAAPSDSYWREYSARQRDPRHYEKMF